MSNKNRTPKLEFTNCINKIADTVYVVCAMYNVCGSRRTTQQAGASPSGAQATQPPVQPGRGRATQDN